MYAIKIRDYITTEQTLKTPCTITFGAYLQVQIEKVGGKYIITNAVNGYGDNCYSEYKDDKVMIFKSIPVERVVKPTLAGDRVEIHLNYSTDGTLRIFGWEPYGEREELDILVGEIVVEHHDHFEVDQSALFRILAKLLQNGQKYIISGH